MIVYGEHSMMEAYESYCKRIVGEELAELWMLNLAGYIIMCGHQWIFLQN